MLHIYILHATTLLRRSRFTLPPFRTLWLVSRLSLRPPKALVDLNLNFGRPPKYEMAVYTLAEVAKHKDHENGGLWMVIHDKVYDVSKFMNEVICKVLAFIICDISRPFHHHISYNLPF